MVTETKSNWTEYSANMSTDNPSELFANRGHTLQSIPRRKASPNYLFECVLCRSELHGNELMVRFPKLLHSLLYPLPRMYGFARELHSLAHRIAAILKLRYRAYLVFLGPGEQESIEYRELCIRTHACTRDIRNFVLSHQWATSLDLETYQVAWHAGARWATCNSCNQEHKEAGGLTCEAPTRPSVSQM
jgi:hypothetical protein